MVYKCRNTLVAMPGSLARYYASQGGEVRVMGKPSTVIYQMALDEMKLDPADVVAIGDSMEHDIAGAASMSIDSIFIAGGIHAKYFRQHEQTVTGGELVVSEASLERMRVQEGVPQACMPTYAIDYLRW
jgi:ribonucleotide monophosphatase NagD (HAD superfamily)